IFTTLVGLAAYYRRMSLPPQERLSAALDLTFQPRHSEGVASRISSVALLSSIIVATMSLGYLALMPRPTERFTEFYLLGPSSKASDYPTRLNVSQPAAVFIVIVNHEAAPVNYTVRVALIGVLLRYNTTSG